MAMHWMQTKYFFEIVIINGYLSPCFNSFMETIVTKDKRQFCLIKSQGKWLW